MARAEEQPVPNDAQLRPEPAFEQDGFRVSSSPWGPDDEIGRLNWITPESSAQILAATGGDKVFDLGVELHIGIPGWTGSGDPPYQQWMTHTPRGSVLDGLTGMPAEVHERFGLCVDSVLMSTHTGTHIDTLSHVTYCGRAWNGRTAAEDMGGRLWSWGGPENYPPIVARGVLLDVAGLYGVDRLPDSHILSAADLERCAREQHVEFRRGDVVLVRTGDIARWPGPDYLANAPGFGLEAARWVCEEAGAMCVGTDTGAFEVLPFELEGTFLPVHAYMLLEAGAQIIEILQLDELAAERIYEFVFVAAPLKLRGTTAAPIRPIAIPLRS